MKGEDSGVQSLEGGSDDHDMSTTKGSDLHKLYHEQLKELENERIELFGTNESLTKQSTVSSSKDDPPPFMEMNMTLDEMNAGREAIYEFTHEEKTAWGSSITDEPLSSEFLDVVNRAREAKALYEASMNQDWEDKMDMMAQEITNAKTMVVCTESSDKILLELDKTTSKEITESDGTNMHVFTHLSEKGDEVKMVDVGNKEITRRIAIARTTVVFPQEVMDAFDIFSHTSSSSSSCVHHEMIGTKGPIFSTAKLAGIMGAKRTSDLIPLCHPLPLEKVRVDIRLEGNRAVIECECRVTHKTGVEMEAMAGASIAALTIYDMVKAVSHNVQIEKTELVTKTGGKRVIQDGMEK